MILTNELTRREMLAGLGGGSVLGLGSYTMAAAPPAPPNIVFIMADDLGYADVGIYGRDDVKTPNIDALAKRGVRFTQAYANSSVCSASRAALITGRYQYRLRLGLEEPLGGGHDIGLPPAHPTLPSLLKRQGYQTVLIGKWHLGSLPRFGPLQSGYDHFFGHRGGAVDYFTHKGPSGSADLWEDNVSVEQQGYITELFGDRAVQMVNQCSASKHPFLLSLHFNAPHWPWELPGDMAEARRIAGSNLQHHDGGTQQIYCGMIEAMDVQIGRVMGALQNKGLLRNTIVIFTSDNGGERFAKTWPFSGQKTELLEGGLRIPAIVSWPAQLPGNRVIEQTAMHMDWLPTLLAASGGGT